MTLTILLLALLCSAAVLIVQFVQLGKPDERSRTIYRHVLSAMCITILIAQMAAFMFMGMYTPELGILVLIITFAVGNAANYYMKNRRIV